MKLPLEEKLSEIENHRKKIMRDIRNEEENLFMPTLRLEPI